MLRDFFSNLAHGKGLIVRSVRKAATWIVVSYGYILLTFYLACMLIAVLAIPLVLILPLLGY